MYYRFTNSTDPMSDYGHAMLCNDPVACNHYGRNLFVYDGKNAVDASDLIEIIKAKLIVDEDFLDGYFADGWDLDLVDDLASGFNPKDIVNSAECWDNSELLTWFWENVAEPNNIMAVLTNDGAIVFDVTMLEQKENIYMEDDKT